MNAAELRARLDAHKRRHRGRGKIIADLLADLADALDTIAAQEQTIDRLSRARAVSLVASVRPPEAKG